LSGSKTANRSPLFDTPDGWGPGYALAVGHGPGVVVGPGQANPNIFAQPFQTQPGRQYEVVARAASVGKPKALAVVQVNWHGEGGRFIAVSKEYFKVSPSERAFHHTVVAPPGATSGSLYVVPGGQKEAVRYTEMSLVHLNQLRHVMSYEFLGIKGQTLLASGTALLLLVLMYIFYRKALFRLGSFLESTIGRPVARIFPLLALALCGALFAFLEAPYERHYDSQFHQASVESVMQWKEPSLDLGGNPMHSFGIQHVINPQLSPTFWVGKLVRANHRIQVQAAFQAMLLFSIMVWICRLAGARVGDAAAISLIAIAYLWIPGFSDEAISLNATLLAFFCFSRIGYDDPGGKLKLSGIVWPAAGFAAAILWLYLSVPELVVFFTLATAGLCLGAILAVRSRRELLAKVGASIVIAAILLALGVYDFVLNLFLYTPQMYYKTLYNYDFNAHFFSTTSLLLSSNIVGGAKVIVFFILAAGGAFIALRFGNRYARHVVFAGLALEAAIHVFSAINAKVELVPMIFTYVEVMGLTVVALLAGTAVWAGLRLGFRTIALGLNWMAPGESRAGAQVSANATGGADHALSYIALLCLVAMVFVVLAGQTHVSSGWPPDTGSAPAAIEARELAVKPGGSYKGKGAVLLGMDNEAPASWSSHFFPVLYFKHRVELGNDLMNDAAVAGIPMANEYGHWISPPMLALLTAAFFRPDDRIDRVAQAMRVFRPALARLLGVSLVVSDQALPGEVELYRGQVDDRPLFIHRVAGANLGQYSPSRTVVARDARQILDHLQAADFDGRTLAIVETPLEQKLVAADQVSVSLHRGPRIHIEAHSQGTSLLVLPFDYSHCLEVKGQGLDRMIPVNLSQTGLVVRGKVSLDISYHYGLVKGTACRKQDLERIKKLNLEEAASGRLFHDARPARAAARP
jgi:hypothetical protein